jgi:hypothetical protein
MVHETAFTAAAQKTSLDPKLLMATAWTESKGRTSGPGSVSDKGAVGMMQVMPASARDPGFGVDRISSMIFVYASLTVAVFLAGAVLEVVFILTVPLGLFRRKINASDFFVSIVKWRRSSQARKRR